MEQQIEGTCYCGATRVTVTGDPVASAYCHCESCRKWHSAPINAWAAWPADKVEITGPTVTSRAHPESQRISCSECGGCVANGKPTPGLMVVYPMTLQGSGFRFEPGFHIFYEERVMDVNDGLPKFADAPEEFGYSGRRVEEPGISRWAG